MCIKVRIAGSHVQTISFLNKYFNKFLPLFSIENVHVPCFEKYTDPPSHCKRHSNMPKICPEYFNCQCEFLNFSFQIQCFEETSFSQNRFL